MALKRNVLVVANVTATSVDLRERLVALAAERPSAFTLILPATPFGDGRDAALTRLGEALEQLQAAGLDVDGTVGDGDPIIAVTDAWDPHRFDEIVVSTLPMQFSKWLHAGLPERIGRLTGAPVTHVVSRPPQPEHAPVAPPEHEKHGLITPLYAIHVREEKRRSGHNPLR
jgi:hypothetical protein